MRVAAGIAVVLLGVLCAFQLALASGAPWGAAAYGGQHPGRLPRRLRMASGVAGLVVYPVAIAVVLAGAGIVASGWLPGGWPLWALTGFFALGVVANLASRSRLERIWAPVSLVVAVCCGVLAAGS